MIQKRDTRTDERGNRGTPEQITGEKERAPRKMVAR